MNSVAQRLATDDQIIFNPGENTTLADRFQAAAEIGGGATLIGGLAAGGVIMAQAMAAGGTACAATDCVDRV